MIHDKVRSFLLVLGLAVMAAAVVNSSATPAEESPTKARCEVTVPAGWGEFVGASAYGVAFRDQQGTLRFVTEAPCGLDAPPHLAMQITRK